MNCAEIRPEDLSAYLDSALESDRAVALVRHLESCPACAAEAEQLEGVLHLVRAHGRIAPPADLALKVKIALSHRAHMRFWDRLQVQVDNFLRPLAIPATAGLLTALLTFGVLIHTFVTRGVTLSEDVPLNLSTPPRLLATGPITFNTGEEGLWVQMKVDGQGRIIDYHLLNAPGDALVLPELRNVLVMTQFEPATTFGKPTVGRTIVNFRRISVKG